MRRALLRPTVVPGRYRCVYCLQRWELVSVCPDCGESIRRSCGCPARRSCSATTVAAACSWPCSTGGARRAIAAVAADRAARRAVDPVGRLRPARRAGQGRARRRRPGDPRRRDGRPLRPADHLRRRRSSPRWPIWSHDAGGDPGRPHDGGAARAPDRRHRQGRRRLRSPSTSRRRRTCTTRWRRSARPGCTAGAAINPATPASSARRGRRSRRSTWRCA